MSFEFTIFHGLSTIVRILARDFVSSGADFSVKIWDWSREQLLQSFPIHSGPVTKFCLPPPDAPVSHIRSNLSVLPLSTASQYCLSVLPLSTASQYCLSVLPLSTASQYCLSVLPLSTASQYCLSVLPLSTASQYCLSVLPLSTASQYCLSVLPLSTASQYCLSVLSVFWVLWSLGSCLSISHI